jgi:two-component system phosphate regulon sensor histidine kinase PhoR
VDGFSGICAEVNSSFESWAYVFGRLVAVGLAGLLLGYMAGSVWAGVCFAYAAALGFHLRQLYLLDYWLRHRSIADPPDSGGLWGDIIAQVGRLHRRKKFHKQRIIRMFRELRRATASMSDGVIALNAGNEILWFNRRASELLGLRRKTDFGIRIDNLIRHPDFLRYLSTRQFGSGLSMHPKVGDPTCLEFQAVPYGAGQMFLLVRDATRQSQLETMRKDFVANASHELRSPLTVIAGYLETLADDPGLDAGLRPPIEEMRRQAERMTGIVADLLELSRLEATDEEVAGEPVDIEALLTQLRKDAASRRDRPSDIRVELASTDALRADPGLVHSAFWNLVDNAIKYTPAGGRIALKWWTDAAGAHLSVSDSGPGIPAEHLPRLTERFYRVDPGRARATGGSGLGLAIVRHVLQRHGGELEIRSAEGRGSVFTCNFPVARVVPGSAVRATA